MKDTDERQALGPRDRNSREGLSPLRHDGTDFRDPRAADDHIAPGGRPVSRDRGTEPDLSPLYFAFDAADLTPVARKRLREVAASMRADSGVRLGLRGFTDSVGTDAYNLALARRRANAVAGELRRLGVEATRIRAEGVGADRVLGQGATPADRAAARRVEIVWDSGNEAEGPEDDEEEPIGRP